jgi:DNA-binding LacI/PurR family transcriptional regulator
MAEIASRLGVAVSTVSRALSDSDQVSLTMKARVREEASALGFVVNPLASSLRTRRSRLLVVLVPTIENYNFPALLRVIEREAARRDYALMIGYVTGDAGTDDRLLEFLFAGAADGVIIATGFAPPSLALRLEGGEFWPGVFVMTPGDRPELPSIALDDYGAGQAVFAAMHAAGHRRFALVTGARGPTAVGRLRRDGFLDAARAAGIAKTDLHVIDAHFTYDAGVDTAGPVADLTGRIDAVFCGSDEIAFGLINGLAERGIDVPSGLAVFGFDDIRFARCFRPALSTVRQPVDEIGARAIDTLMQMIETRQSRPSIVLPHDVVLRDSAPGR